MGGLKGVFGLEEEDGHRLMGATAHAYKGVLVTLIR
jgi:hypothetical protein